MSSTATPAAPAEDEVKYGGYSRFEIELEVLVSPSLPFPPLFLPLTFLSPPCVKFVQSLANPWYLNHIASQKLLTQPAFVAYLAYLRYWTRPPYLQFLTYPGPTLRHLELLQHERFRHDIMSPDVAARLFDEGMRAAVEWHREG